ncbi:MAG: hypothetical protein GY878_23125 [Fuerstiella sp.]|jgi:hypothetical protein|nr:hypothetical protein [Fuerstiella sp.]
MMRLEVKAKSGKRRAKARIALAEEGLKQHEKWRTTGEVPEEQVEKAKRILEHARKVYSEF